MGVQTRLRLFCSHGAALFFIAQHPDCTIREIAGALVVTRRTVWGLIGDLKGAGLLHIRKEGRINHYTIREDAPFPDPLLSHLPVGRVFQLLVS